MRKLFLLAGMVLLVCRLFAQQNPPTYSGGEGDGAKKGFNKENIFIGGNIALGFYTDVFNIGANPEIGYSVAQWLDAGVVFNINYTSQKADPYYNGNEGIKYTSYGAGVFARIYPVRFLFVALQPEQNWGHYTSTISGSVNTQATSFIAGIGYASRFVGQSSSFIMVGFDLLHNTYSPYNDPYTGSALPIIRAGFDFYLHPSRRR